MFRTCLKIIIYFLFFGSSVVQGATVNLTVDKNNVNEGDIFTLTVSLDINPGEDTTGLLGVIVVFTTTGTGSDFASLPSSTKLDLNNRSDSFPIQVLKDNLTEGRETFNFKIGILPVGNGNIMQGHNIQQITVLEKQLGQLQFGSSGYTVDENSSSATITVVRTGGSDESITVNYTTSNETAQSGTDYQSTMGTLSWQDGESGTKNFTVRILDNTKSDGDKTLKLHLTGASLSDARLTILDDESEQITSGEEEDENTSVKTNQRDIGNVIGTICDSKYISSNLKETCDKLIKAADNAPNEFSQALPQLLPDEYRAQAYLASETTATQFKNIDARSKVLHNGHKGFNVSGLKLNVNMQGTQLPNQLLNSFLQYATDETTEDIMANFSRLGMFINGEINFGDKNTTEHEVGFDFSTVGLTTGVDYRFTKNFVAGVALGYSKSETNFNEGNGTIDNDGYSLSLYGTHYQNDAFYIDGVYSYGRNSYNNLRKIVYHIGNTDINQTALSNNKSTQHAFGVGMGYNLNRNAFNFTPNIRIDYIQTDVDEIHEKFAAPLAAGAGLEVVVQKQSLKSLMLTLGIQADYVMSHSWGILIPHIDLDLVHEFENDSQQMSASFLADASHESFTWLSDSPDKDYFNLGFGVMAQMNTGKSAFLRYEGTLGLRDIRRHAIMGGVRLEF